MKLISKIAVSVLALSAVATSCTKNFEDINTNPNKLNYGDIQAYNCYESIIYTMGREFQDNCHYWCNNLVQFTAYTAGAVRPSRNYQVTDGNWQSIWDGYARIASDCQHMITLAKAEEDKFFEALGLILKVQNLSSLSAMVGDIPYDEAFKFKDNLTPAFESQEMVIQKCIRDLDSANVILSRNPKPYKSGLDGIYGDDVMNWRKYANSMKARLLCRAASIKDSEQGESYYWGEIAKMYNDQSTYPLFESVDDNAQVNFQNVDPYKSHYFYNSSGQFTESDMTNYRTCAQVIKVMTVQDSDGNTLYEDPRLPIYSTQKKGRWIGTIAGCTPTEQEAIENESPAVQNFKTLCNPETPAFLMEYSELLFILAEGTLKGKLSLGKTAKEFYNEAVTASIRKWAPYAAYNSKSRPVRDVDIETFLASPIGSYDVAEAGTGLYKSAEELIHTQKWLSLYYVDMEAYHEWRRTEYPVLTIGNGTQYNDYELPSRFGYPGYTVSTNNANVVKALERMGGKNDMHTPLDWSYKKHNGKNRNPHPNAN